jgi:hypothetical protein
MLNSKPHHPTSQTHSGSQLLDAFGTDKRFVVAAQHEPKPLKAGIPIQGPSFHSFDAEDLRIEPKFENCM